MDLARDERADMADFLETLTPEQWTTPSLCDAWRVRDVVAHVIGYEGLGLGGIVKRVARSGLSAHTLHGNRIAEFADLGTDELIALFRRNPRPRGVTALFGGRIGLTDGLIHHQDVRRPLGLPREIPPDRLRVALDFARWAPPIAAAKRIRGLRIVATDVDWSYGDGPLVEGRAEPLLMAIAGRRGTTGELTGPGGPTLASRVET